MDRVHAGQRRAVVLDLRPEQAREAQEPVERRVAAVPARERPARPDPGRIDGEGADLFFDVAATTETFEQDVLERSASVPVVVDFWADWCGPCKMVAPVLEEIAGTHADKLTVAKLDVDANPRTARDYQILSLPTMMLFSGGKPVKQIVGAKGKAALLRELEGLI